MKKNKNLIFAAASLVVFVLIAVLYAHPVLTGKQLFQHDIVQYKGGAKELLDYRAEHGKETYWSDSMFGGMPTYQMGAQFRGDLIRNIDGWLNFLPKPANYIFLLFAGFYLLGWVAVRNWKYALLGASFFGLSTYFYIALAAGHNGKIHTVAYFAPLIAGILLVYIRRKYVAGFIVTALFMGLQISANHPQMTYYLFLALAFLFLSELVRTIRVTRDWKHFGLSSGILAVAMVLGVGMNSQRLMANSEYVGETVRGKQILTNERHDGGKAGMDKESMLMWSYGKLETLNLFIPRLMGGASNEKGSDEMMAQVQQLVQENASSQEEVNRIAQGFSSLTYWGEQPGTSGPAYQGAVVCFLAVLGFFLGWKKYRYWILGASVLTILLAWGSNFMIISDLFIDFVPFYNKFRAPSSILVVVELLFPLIAIIGLYRYFNSGKNSSGNNTDLANEPVLTADVKKKTLISVTAAVLGITVLLLIFGKSILGFHTAQEKTYLPPYLLEYLVGERYSMFAADAVKAILFVLAAAGSLWLFIKDKISQNVALMIIGLVSFVDLWSVDHRYLNSDNFIDKTFTENPFQTETSDLLFQKVGDNSNLMGLLSNVNVNKTLEEIAEKDQSHYRIYNQTLGTFSETNTSYFKSSVGGYHAVKLRRYDDLIDHYFSRMDTVKVPRILNMLNTKYMIFGSAQEPQAVANPTANGNAWFVSGVVMAENPNQEIDLIGEMDTRKTAIIGKDDAAYFKDKKMQRDSAAYLELKSYEPNHLTFSSVSATPQLAVFSEIYYPHGWKMLIDGSEVPYIKANYLLRAVHVPAGKHTVEMIFAPKVIETGKTVSLIAFALFILLSLAGLFLLYRNYKAKIAPEKA